MILFWFPRDSVVTHSGRASVQSCRSRDAGASLMHSHALAWEREKKMRDFYELRMIDKTSQFFLNGTIDFVVSEGLVESKKPYFFIQEFKRSEEYGNPRPQLLAELISAIELNDWKFIKGAYIIGGSWHFAILEKLNVDKYQYFISQNFDSTKIDDLKLIYKNLLFVKNEIISMVEA